MAKEVREIVERLILALTQTHIDILTLIHGSENHGIKGDELIQYQIEISNFSEIIEQLVKEDLVEYEIKEHTYYLAYDGFTALEEFEKQKTSKHRQERPPIDFYKEIVDSYGGSKSLNRQILGAILFFGILATIYFSIFPDRDFTKTNDIENTLDKSTLKKVESDVNNLMDSIEHIDQINKEK